MLAPTPFHPSRPYAPRGGNDVDAPASNPNLPRVPNPREVPTPVRAEEKRPQSGQEARPHAERRDERKEESVGTRRTAPNQAKKPLKGQEGFPSTPSSAPQSLGSPLLLRPRSRLQWPEPRGVAQRLKWQA